MKARLIHHALTPDPAQARLIPIKSMSKSGSKRLNSLLNKPQLAALVSAIAGVPQLKEQRLEGSRRHYFTRRRNVTFPRLNLLQPQGPAGAGAMELPFAAK